MSSSLDSTVRVWFDRPATSLYLSPASDMMAMAHVGDLGIYLWTNKTVYDRVALQQVREEAGPPARHGGAGGGRRHGRCWRGRLYCV